MSSIRFNWQVNRKRKNNHAVPATPQYPRTDRNRAWSAGTGHYGYPGLCTSRADGLSLYVSAGARPGDCYAPAAFRSIPPADALVSACCCRLGSVSVSRGVRSAQMARALTINPNGTLGYEKSAHKYGAETVIACSVCCSVNEKETHRCHYCQAE